MLIEKVVVNSSPLIVLFKSEQADLLPLLFKRIVVPEQVFSEVTDNKGDDSAKKNLPFVEWIIREKVEIPLSIAAWNLGKGESSVFAYAMVETEHWAIVDDLAARRCAKTFGIQTIGTGGLLILAKRRGIIKSVKRRIDRFRDAGLYLSESVIQLLLSEAGE